MSSGSIDYKSYQEEEDELISASMMGDIREDIEFLGLTFTDIIWISVNTLVWGGLVVLSPLTYWVSVPLALGIFVFNFIGRILKWPYRRKRRRFYRSQKKSGLGENIEEFLGVKEDSWFYRSPRMVQLVLKVTAPPWNVAEVSKKRTRLTQFEFFLRSCVVEGFEAQFSAEQIPDFQHEIWNARRKRQTVTEGIESLKMNRIRMWEDMAETRKAKRSEYTLRLRINEIHIENRERDDEPEGLSKAELKRHRMVAELHEKLERVLGPLIQSGHTCELIGGTHIPELIGRWWDQKTWEEWKKAGGSWEEESDVPTEPVSLHKPRLAELKEHGVLQGRSSESLNENEQEAVMSPEEIQVVETEPEKEKPKRKGKLTLWFATFIRTVWNALLSPFKRKKRVLVMPVLSDGNTVNSEDTETAELASVLEVDPSAETNPENAIEGNSERLRGKFKAKLGRIVLLLKEEAERLSRWRREKKRKRQEETPVAEPATPSVSEEPAPSEKVHMYTLSGVRLITSPSPTGVTFLASNIAAATSREKYPVSLIDLSPERGTITILNPLPSPERSLEKWSAWSSVHAPELTLYTPEQGVTFAEVVELIQMQQGLVLVDMPWNFPGRVHLMNRFPCIGVVDSDYHHWLQWEKAAQQWDGDLWMNQVEGEMNQHISNLIRNHFGKEASVSFPTFRDAQLWIYEGRPLAVHNQARRFFDLSESEV